MSDALSLGATIIVAQTGEQFHTLDDWGFATGNNNYIGEPEQHTEFISVKGRNGLLDISEALTGRPTFSSRPITIYFGGIRTPRNWDIVISDLRNKIEGKQIKLIFDNDPSYYWIGRCHIEGFDRIRDLGTFTLSIPKADPYKYRTQEFNEDWLWDSFNFETDYVTEAEEYTIDGYQEVRLPAGTMPVAPTVIVTDIGASLTVQKYGDTREIDLYLGENKVYAITVNDIEESILIFRGKGTFSINYRGGSL